MSVQGLLPLVRREFTVDVPLQQAWEHLAHVEAWPSWAAHIKSVAVEPHGPLGPTSAGSLRLSNGVKSTFRMADFDPPRRWKWVGPFLWLTVHYDHLFEEVDAGHTKLTWIVQGEGFAVSVLGRLFAKVYDRNLDRAVPALIEEMNAAAS